MWKLIVSIFLLMVVSIVAYEFVATKNTVREAMLLDQNTTQQQIIPEKQTENIAPKNTTGIPLSLPDGFSISIFASDLPGARVLAFDKDGNMWVSQLSQGIVSKLTIENDAAINKQIVLRNLNEPHGLAFDPDDPLILYVAEQQRISRFRTDSSSPTLEKIVDLPSGRGHSTRTIKFGPDGRLYVHIGSSCNVCIESDSQRAAIFSLNKDGSDFREYARGLRNTVFFTWNPADGKMWGSDNGRDLLGDNIPPDEINVIEQGKDYGWPFCYGNNIHDDSFDASNSVSCTDKTPSKIDLQAHSAPLGFAFAPSQGWPEDYKNDLIVSFHGSWNRSVPTGYKIVRLKMDPAGNYLGTEDFITGWLTPNRSVLGRPVDITVQETGTMYVSDDNKGVVYKIMYSP